ncbi:MAG: hypothetical protein JWO13_1478 [Acidobacteriales bacterium]|nr:hypothetical protein [Terriglobales bacterium]
MKSANRRAKQQQAIGIILVVLLAALFVFARYRHAIHLTLK